VLLTVNSYGHPVELPSPCADKWRVRYLVHLVTPAARDGLRSPAPVPVIGCGARLPGIVAGSSSRKTEAMRASP